MSKLLDYFSQTQNSIREGEKTVSIAQKLFFVTFFSLSLEKGEEGIFYFAFISFVKFQTQHE